MIILLKDVFYNSCIMGFVGARAVLFANHHQDVLQKCFYGSASEAVDCVPNSECSLKTDKVIGQ